MKRGKFSKKEEHIFRNMQKNPHICRMYKNYSYVKE